MLRICLLLVLTVATAFAQNTSEIQPAHQPLSMEHPVEDKIFYLLASLQKDAKARSAIDADPVLSRLHSESLQTLDKAIRSCGEDAICHVTPLLWSDDEIEAVRKELTNLYRQKGPVRSFVDHQLRASGVFELYSDRPGDELLAQAWSDEAHGVNHILEVYGEGHAPLYSKIDGISYDPHSSDFGQKVHATTVHIRAEMNRRAPFYDPSLKMALALLELNHRDEAGRFEPMERGENAAAYAAVAHTKWPDYPYSVIIVPGAGPGDPNTPLSERGKERLALAVQRYHEGKAPFLLVSGGYVHPVQTRFCEAFEMKRYLVEKLGIPASAVLIDPHARHTTTNLRNAVRILYRYSIPFDKPVLITTDEAQSRYITDAGFGERCKNEMGLIPYLSLKRISSEDIEMRPSIQSLDVNSMEPLDP